MGLFKRKRQVYGGYKKQYPISKLQPMNKLKPVEYVDAFTWIIHGNKDNSNTRLAGSDNVPTKRQRDIVKRQNESVKTIEPKPELFDWEKEI